MNRLLILMFEGAPICFATTINEAIEVIRTHPDEDHPCFDVVAIRHAASQVPPEGYSWPVAAAWLGQIGTEPAPSFKAFLNRYPAFVRLNCEDDLAREFDALRTLELSRAS